MSQSFELSDLDALVTGTTGPKGQRVFFLQAQRGTTVVTLKVEKQQVLALADYLDQLLTDLPPTDDDPPEVGHLVEPLAPEWTVGAIGVAYEPDTDRLLLVAEELVTDDDADTDPATARFQVGRRQVVAFIDQARQVAAAGRPPCPFCGRPLDGDGSFCPCSN